MITINVSEDKITINGHALYDDYGRDIVCASVSSIVITSINAILLFNKEAIKYLEGKDELEIQLLKKDKNTKLLVSNMINLLTELANQYEKNIKIIGG